VKLRLTGFILLALMVAAGLGALALKPTQKLADQGPKIDLAAMIPQQFGDWREEPQQAAQVINPQQKEVLDKIYNQTLSRTYSNAKGYRIMLSIAYGGDQSRDTQVHKPEVCYPAQGFTVLSRTAGGIALPFGLLPITHVDTELGQRREPITYWITVGDKVVQDGIRKKFVELRYRFSGRIPDGLLVRVSSIDPTVARAYDLQANFVSQLLGAVTPEQRQRLAGSFGGN
jgi:EpsI family protein